MGNPCQGMKQADYSFNVYSADGRWMFVEPFWSAVDWGLSIGDFVHVSAGELYNKAVYVKRMT